MIDFQETERCLLGTSKGQLGRGWSEISLEGGVDKDTTNKEESNTA